MELRVATVADARAIAVVHIASIREAYRSLFPAPALGGLDIDDRAERWRQILTEHTSTVLVAEADGQMLGFASFGRCRDEDVEADLVGEIMSIYVAPDSWKQGIGWRLLRAAHHDMAKAGFREARLWVLDRNSQAIALYERAGFVRDGRIKQHEIHGVTATIVRYSTQLTEDYVWNVGAPRSG
jgi:L-amino acid N-acyltransferase YncA